MLLHSPDTTHRIRLPTISVLPATTTYVKLYDAADARIHGYTSTDFNPTAVPDTAKQRGRFSSTAKDRYAYMYVAECETPVGIDESVAVWEMLDHDDIGVSTSGYSVVSEAGLLPELTFAYLRFSRSLRVLDIRDQRELAAVRALLHGGINGLDYRVPRRWARYLRAELDIVDGFRYSSYRLGAARGLSALVVFSETTKAHPRAPLAASLVLPEVRARSDEGKDLLQAALGNGIALV